MKAFYILIVLLLLSACGHRGAPTATSTPLEFYTFSEGDAYRYMAQGRSCWAEENRANWDAC